MGHSLSSTQPAMKTFVVLATLLALAIADGSDFSDCPGKDNSAFVSAYTLNIKPDPIVAKKDQHVQIHFNANVIKAFPAGTTLDFTLEKEGVKLPCLSLPGVPIKVGSCTYEAQQLLDLVPDDLWAKFAPAGQAKTLPLNPGKYGDLTPAAPSIWSSLTSQPSLFPSSRETSMSLSTSTSMARTSCALLTPSTSPPKRSSSDH